jgi:3-hydroxyacyl-CoA dehydrogenase
MFVAVLGAGRMGAQIGCEYALGGHSVIFVAPRPERARERIGAALEMVRRHGLGSADAASGRIALRSHVAGDEPVELVVESLPEDRELKRRVIVEAAASWPDATIATNTSSIGVSELGRLAGVSERIIATHYWNPPLLMPLVEMLAGGATPFERLERVAGLLRRIGKRPVLLRAEVHGMLWNRLQLALLREAVWLVEHAVATPNQIDEVVRDGLARRWRLLGPFETVSLGGAAVFDSIADNLFPVLSNARSGSGFGPHLVEDPGALAELERRRDEGLATELMAERSRHRRRS